MGKIGLVLADEIPDYQVLSPKCEMETLALVNNTALQAAVPQTLLCEINFDVAKTCTVDYMTVSIEFETVCVQQGGQFYIEDLHWDCDVEIYGQKYSGDYFFLNYPGCFGISCNATEIRAEYEATAFPQAEIELATQGFVCDIMVKSDARTSSTITSIGVLASFVFTVSISTFF